MKIETAKRIVPATALILVLLATSIVPSLADTIPANYISVNFSPINSTTSSNYDFSTGELTTSTATASIFSTANLFQAVIFPPQLEDPNGYGTFIGTAKPTRFNGETVLYEQSVCGTGYPACFGDGTFTYGYMVMYTMRGKTLDQLTNLQTQYNVQSGCFGGGSPRFSIAMSNGAQIHVYLGTYPAFMDCPPPTWTSTGNLATDLAGFRWDSSQVCPGTFYNSYSGAVACANTFGLTISAIFLGADGGWIAPNAGTQNGQTFLFKDIQVNSLTRFK